MKERIKSGTVKNILQYESPETGLTTMIIHYNGRASKAKKNCIEIITCKISKGYTAEVYGSVLFTPKTFKELILMSVMIANDFKRGEIK